MGRFYIVEKSVSGPGSRGGVVMGHTQSGKPIYASARHPEHKGFSQEDHADAAQAHDVKIQNLGRERHAQSNGDGTFSKKHAATKKKLTKEIEHHAQQKAVHRDKADPQPHSPDQRDFDRMDRKNDPQGRSKVRKGMLSHFAHAVTGGHGGPGSRGGKVIGHTGTGKPIYENSHKIPNHGFTQADHEDAMHAHAGREAAMRDKHEDVGWDHESGLQHDALLHAAEHHAEAAAFHGANVGKSLTGTAGFKAGKAIKPVKPMKQAKASVMSAHPKTSMVAAPPTPVMKSERDRLARKAFS